MRKIRELTGGGVDVMLDGIGGTNALRSYRALASSGRPVMFGHYATLEKGRRTTKSMESFYAAGSLTLAGNLLPGGRRVGTYRSATTRDLHPEWYRTGLGVLFRLYLDGHLHPLIASRLSLSDARHAQRTARATRPAPCIGPSPTLTPPRSSHSSVLDPGWYSPRGDGLTIRRGWGSDSQPMAELRLQLLGVGAMRSPRFAPAGLLVSYAHSRVAFDGGPGAEPDRRIDAWLVTDDRSELRREIRRLAAAHGLEPAVASFAVGDLSVQPRPVAHTSHPTVGYMIRAGERRVAWAPEFWTFPEWAAGVDLLFADAAGWDRPIRFAGGVGGHASALAVARDGREREVKRLVFAHIGRPTIRAMDAGAQPPFGEFGEDGRCYRLRADS